MKPKGLFQTKRKIIVVALVDLLIITGLILYFGLFAAPPDVQIKGVYIKNSNPINDFKLQATSGNSFNKENLKGHWTLVFFGFTNCPMICPTTMRTLKRTYEQLQSELPANKLPKVLFISVDPSRDSIEKIGNFVKAFHPDFIGARADKNEVKALQTQLHTPVSSEPNAHGLDIILLNPAVEVQAYFSYPISSLQLATDIKAILKKSSMKYQEIQNSN